MGAESALSVYFAVLAGITALRVSPSGSFGEVVQRIGAIAPSCNRGVCGGDISLRPRGWGHMSGRVAMILLATLAGLMVWSHMFLFRNAQGVALMYSLAIATILANLPKLGVKEFLSLSKAPRLAMRVIYGCMLVIITAAVGADEIIQTGAFAFSDVGFHLFMGIFGATLYFQMVLWQVKQA